MNVSLMMIIWWQINFAGLVLVKNLYERSWPYKTRNLHLNENIDFSFVQYKFIYIYGELLITLSVLQLQV